MRRYWIDKKNILETEVLIDGDDFHHIIDVCRQDVGSKFEVLGLDNQAILVEVIQVQKKKAMAKRISQREIPQLPRPHIHLVLSLPRYQVMDAVIEKAVEMGVHSIHPVVSEFSFIRNTNKLPDGKAERWERIVKSATQQCGRSELMTIQELKPLSEILSYVNQKPGLLGLFAYEGSAEVDVRTYLKTKQSSAVTDLWVFVGSEGGFSQTEVQLFRDAGFSSITLGDQVLRVETACIALLAVLKYEFGLMCNSGGKHGSTG